MPFTTALAWCWGTSAAPPAACIVVPGNRSRARGTQTVRAGRRRSRRTDHVHRGTGTPRGCRSSTSPSADGDHGRRRARPSDAQVRSAMHGRCMIACGMAEPPGLDETTPDDPVEKRQTVGAPLDTSNQDRRPRRAGRPTRGPGEQCTRGYLVMLGAGRCGCAMLAVDRLAGCTRRPRGDGRRVCEDRRADQDVIIRGGRTLSMGRGFLHNSGSRRPRWSGCRRQSTVRVVAWVRLARGDTHGRGLRGLRADRDVQDSRHWKFVEFPMTVTKCKSSACAFAAAERPSNRHWARLFPLARSVR